VRLRQTERLHRVHLYVKILYPRPAELTKTGNPRKLKPSARVPERHSGFPPPQPEPRPRLVRDGRRIKRGWGLYDLQRGTHSGNFAESAPAWEWRWFSANGLVWRFRNERRIGIFDIVYRVKIALKNSQSNCNSFAGWSRFDNHFKDVAIRFSAGSPLRTDFRPMTCANSTTRPLN